MSEDQKVQEDERELAATYYKAGFDEACAERGMQFLTKTEEMRARAIQVIDKLDTQLQEWQQRKQAALEAVLPLFAEIAFADVLEGDTKKDK